MKKIISVLLILLLCLTPVSVSANTPEIDASQTMMGDANNDKNVNAADARIVLRVASKLEPADKVSLFNADANGDEKINSSDARLILRAAANLTEFVYGFDGNGVPCAINVLKNNKYYIDLTYKDEISSDAITISLAKDGNNAYMSSADMGFEMGEMDFSNCGMMINDNKIYAILGNSAGNIAMYIPDSMCEDLGMNREELALLTDMIDEFIPEDIGTAIQKTINNETVYQYTYEIENQTCFLRVASNGELLSIAHTAEDSTLISFSNISFDNVDKFFDLDNYDLL